MKEKEKAESTAISIYPKTVWSTDDLNNSKKNDRYTRKNPDTLMQLQKKKEDNKKK